MSSTDNLQQYSSLSPTKRNVDSMHINSAVGTQMATISNTVELKNILKNHVNACIDINKPAYGMIILLVYSYSIY